MKLLGVDVGFSKTRPTTGIAVLFGDRLTVEKAGSEWSQRRHFVPSDFCPTIIALDGPLLPFGAAELARRECELLFVRAPYPNRCKPGLSHSGSGLELRRAATESCRQFSQTLSGLEPSRPVSVHRDGPIVEAFPNAFLGVLTSNEDFLSAPRFKRGKRFDWLYDRVVGTGELQRRLSPILDLPEIVWSRLRTERDHEKRAALICLLTAAVANVRIAQIVGEETGGWFWLPPVQLWQPWARDALQNVGARFI